MLLIMCKTGYSVTYLFVFTYLLTGEWRWFACCGKATWVLWVQPSLVSRATPGNCAKLMNKIGVPPQKNNYYSWWVVYIYFKNWKSVTIYQRATLTFNKHPVRGVWCSPDIWWELFTGRSLSFEGHFDSGPCLSHLDSCVISLQFILQRKLCLYAIVQLSLEEFKYFSQVIILKYTIVMSHNKSYSRSLES